MKEKKLEGTKENKKEIRDCRVQEGKEIRETARRNGEKKSPINEIQ
jgi:hypothetical protein